jgi:LmbE family N-acetylglucosaminyl deacetylase
LTPPIDDPPRSRPDSQQHSRLFYRINSLRMAGAILHIGAHPDDEESGMIAYMTHRRGVRTVYWSATRGEGGQNRRGAEKSDSLGIIRTWESLEARDVDGGEVLYGPFKDFGFSKSGEDTLLRWGRDDVVREIVRAIRMVQPLVVICRWSGVPRDGHGHHQAIGLVAEEAFEGAGDPSRYRELADQGLAPWQAKKLYRSVAGDWQPGETAEFGQIVDEYERAGYLRINTGEFDPVSGLTYQEQAVLSINRHLSQGMNFVPAQGAYYYYYRLDRCLVSAGTNPHDLFDGLDPSLTGLADYPGSGYKTLRSLLEKAQRSAETAAEIFQPQRPADAGLKLAEGVSVLVELRDSLDAECLDCAAAAALDAYLARTIHQFEAATAACFGLSAECLVDRPRPTPGSRVGATVRVWNGGAQIASVAKAELRAPSGWKVRPLDNGPAAAGAALFEASYEIELPASAAFSTPYWLREPSMPYRYQWPQAGPSSQPLDPPLLTAMFVLKVGPHRLKLNVPAIYRSGFMGGFRELPVSVLPSMAVSPRQSRELFPVPHTDARVRLDVTVRCIEDGGAAGMMMLAAPDRWLVEPAHFEMQFSHSGESRVLRFEVTIPADAKDGVHELRYEHAGQIAAVEFEPVRLGTHGNTGFVDETNCTTEVFCTRPATVRFHLIDVEFVRTLRYGYVSGLKEDVVPALARFGLDIVTLTDEDLAFADLKAFQSIVIGPNAYNSRPSLREHSVRLNEYIADGGVLIVQYQGYGYDAEGLAPYPFRYHQPHDRVTIPDAPVEIIDQGHPVLQFPNVITREDFDGWVGDRGLYFFGEWDRQYAAILASNDRGEQPRRGGFLVAAYGRGTYVYAAYSFFRQIPAGVPGAVRLFANILGLGEARIRQRMEFLRSLDLFAFMPAEQLYEAARMMYERRVEGGKYLAREGDHGSELFVVVEGTIDVVRHVQADDRVIYTARQGEAIGEFAILANIPRSASLRAGSDVTIIVLPASAFQDLLRRYPDLSLRVMELLVRKIVAQNEKN